MGHPHSDMGIRHPNHMGDGADGNEHEHACGSDMHHLCGPHTAKKHPLGMHGALHGEGMHGYHHGAVSSYAAGDEGGAADGV